MSVLSWHLWYPGVASFMHYLSGPPPPCREPILTTHCLVSEDWWNPDLGLHGLFTATYACLVCRANTTSAALPDPATSSLLSQWHREPFRAILRPCLKNSSFHKLEPFFGGWGLALSVPVQNKKFLFNDASLSVNHSCFPSIPCLWLWTRSCPFPCRAAHFVSLWCICCLSL